MKTFYILLTLIILLSGCKPEELTFDEIAKEKAKITSRIESFLSSYAKKDLNKILTILSGSNEFHYLGSDIAEINNNKSEFQNQLINDWNLFDSIYSGELRNLSIVVSADGELASAIFDAPITVDVKGNQSRFFFRISLTFIKENSLWQLAQGLSSIPSVGESSIELLKK